MATYPKMPQQGELKELKVSFPSDSASNREAAVPFLRTAATKILRKSKNFTAIEHFFDISQWPPRQFSDRQVAERQQDDDN